MSERGDPEIPLLARLPAPPRKVALLRPSRIGDFICAGPALRALRRALPGAEITMITLPLLQELAERSPHVDRFVPFPGYPGLAEQLFDARQTLLFFQQMQAEQFDLAIQMQGSGVYSNPFTLMLGARFAAGYIREGDGPGRLDAALPLPLAGHEVERLLALTTFLGAPPRGKETEYPLLPVDHEQAGALLAGARPPLIGLHPGAWDRTRQWPLDRFAAVGRELQRRSGGTILLIGGPMQQEPARALTEMVGQGTINLAGRTSLGSVGAVIRRLALLVTNDSGPAHIAYALGTPTLTIFGGADPHRYGPPVPGPFRLLLHDVPCRPCYDPTCPIGYHCLQEVTVAQVIEAASEWLG